MIKRTLAVFVTAIILLSIAPFAVSAGGSFTEFTDYYARGALAEMQNGEALVYAYDNIAAAVASHASSASVYDGSHPISFEEVNTVMDAYRRDYVQHFWIANSYGFSYNSTTVLSVSLRYLYDADASAAANAQLETAVADALSGVDPSMSELELELYLHDYLCSTVEYADGDNAHNAYGALVEHTAVCEGYAEAFQLLLYRVGIPAFTAIGSSDNPSTGMSEGHEWSYAKIGGKWYHVDVTWDDQGDIFHRYFNMSDALVLEDHRIDETAYALPVCDSTDAFYFNTFGTTLESYTTDSLAAIVAANDLTADVYVPSGSDAFLNWFRTNFTTVARAAGVTGAFSVSYSYLGNEIILFYIVNPTGVSLPASLELYVGESAALTPTFTPANATERAAVWSSDAEGVATVDQSGVVTAIAAGSANISFTTNVGGFIATCAVSVSEPLAPVNGDVDGDHALNLRDVVLLMKYLVGQTGAEIDGIDLTLADYDGNGKLNNRDILLMMLAIVDAEG